MKKLFTLFAAMLIATMGFAAEATATISFANKAQRTVYTTSQQVWEQNGIVVTNDKASSTNNVGDYANPARFYKNSKVTIQCTLGNIKKIEISGWGDSKYNVWVTSVGSEAAASGSSVVITPTAVSDTYVVNMTGGQGRARQMVVTYEVSDAGFVSTPAIEGEQYFKESTTVSMKAADGLTIYYTVDGTEPTTASTAYTAPFALDKTTTVKAVASDGTNLSEVVTVEFKKMQVLTCAEAAAITPAGDKYIVRGYVTTANAYSTQYNNIDFFMADTKDGGEVLKIFRAVAASETDKDVKVGDYVEVIGELAAYQGTIQIAQGGTYTIIPAPVPAATVIVVENTTVAENGQNIALTGAAGERNLTISLWQGGATQGFGTYSGAGEGDYYGSFTNPYADLAAVGDATYTDNGNGTFTFKAIMTDGTAQYDITMNGLIPVKHTYTVAGSPVAVFGTEYDPKNAENDMFLYSGTIYAWEKSNLTLSAGKIEFKVCEDHAWTVAYPAQNYVLNIPESGIYTIMIMFDAASGMVEAFAEKTGDAVVIPTIAIAGDMNGWNTTANTFTIAEDEKTASLALNLEAKDYGFKMIVAGSWTSDAQKITRENNVATYTGANADNGTLTADVAGEYIFTWTYETNTLVVTYPAKEEPQPVATWDEIVFTEVAAKGSLNGAVFTAATNAAFTLTVTDTDASKVEVDANTASFGTAEENATYTFRLKTGGKSSAKNVLTLAIPADGKLRIAARPGSKDATDRNIVVKQGETELYNQVVLEEKVGDYYSYVLVDVKQGTVTIEYPVNSLFLYAFGFKAVAGPTVGFENIEATEKAVKFIENGQIFILRDGAVFNLMGARVK